MRRTPFRTASFAAAVSGSCPITWRYRLEQSSEKLARHYQEGSVTAENVPLVVEEPLEIRVNGSPHAVLMRTPGDDLDLAAGFCLTEGIIDSYKEIIHLGYCDEAGGDAGNVVNLLIDREDRITSSIKQRTNRAFESRSSCGVCGVRMLDDLRLRLPVLEPGFAMEASSLVRLQYTMLGKQRLFKTTWGGTHAVALADSDGELIVVREDVGRHNALDKVIGYTMQNNIDCRNCMALLSSRISFEMVQKAVRAGIPLVAAISTATSLAVELAEASGCTLVGRLRNWDMFIYTHPHRVLLG